MFKILRSKRGQATWDMLITAVGVAAIGFVIAHAMLNPIGKLHDNAIKGITTITGSGM